MSLEQYFPKIFGTEHGFVKRLDIREFENRLKGLSGLDKYFRVEFSGMKNIPKKGGALIIGNHGPMGIDAAFVVKHVYEEAGRVVRPLGDRLIFKIPVFRVLLNTMGVLEGEASQAVEIMQAGELCSVYPGGYAETIKSPEDKYQVRQFWQNHLGYIKVALKAQVPIVPIVCIGVDDTMVQIKTAEQTTKFPPARALQKYMDHGKYKVPLWMGLGPLPMPVKFTYHVGKPIELGYGPESVTDQAVLNELNEKIITIVEGMLDDGLAVRENQRDQRRDRLMDRVNRGPKFLRRQFDDFMAD